MSDRRFQINLRLKKHQDVYHFIKATAEKEGLTVNDFLINLLREWMGLDVEKTPVAEALDRISILEEKFEKLESNLLGENRA